MQSFLLLLCSKCGSAGLFVSFSAVYFLIHGEKGVGESYLLDVLLQVVRVSVYMHGHHADFK